MKETIKFYAWKNPNCNGENPEYIEMSKKQFFEFIRKDENKHRKFKPIVKALATDPIYYFEVVPKEQYEWRKKLKRMKLKKEKTPDYKLVSMDYPLSEHSVYTLHEIIPDDSVSVEELLIQKYENQERKKWFEGSFIVLTQKQLKVVLAIYHNNEGLKEHELANELGISQKAFSNRKIAGYEKIKVFLSKSVDFFEKKCL